MSRVAAGTLTARILAVLVAVDAARGLPALTSAFAIALATPQVTSAWALAVASVVSFGLLVLLATLLWLGACRFTRGMAEARPQDAPSSAAWPVSELQAAAFCALGMLLLVLAIPDAIRLLVQFATTPAATGAPSSALIRGLTPQLASYLVQLAFGVWLLLGARGVVAWIGRLRRFGLDHLDRDGD